MNQRWQYSGIDSPENCLNKNHFYHYTFEVSYEYNSRGFRDSEWPDSVDELRDAIWCLGDSFTVGLGQPLAHTWPKVLEATVGRRCINVSMDGASNDWIRRRMRDIKMAVQPRNMVIMWSYLSRRESPDDTLSDEDRRLHYDLADFDQDVNNFNACVQSVIENQGSTQVMMFIIPKFARFDGEPSWSEIKGISWPPNIPTSMQKLQDLPPMVKKELLHDFNCWDGLVQYIDVKAVLDRYKIQVVPQLDWARDAHHFDIATTQWVVNKIMTDGLDLCSNS
jgi:hypothetical protein